MAVLAWANGMWSAVKSVSNLYLSLFLSPRLVYNEIIEHYLCILSLAWVPEGCAGLGTGTCTIPVLWWLQCLCTTASCVGTAGCSKCACQADSPFRHHVLVVHDLSLTKCFWKYIFITLISTWQWSLDDNIWNQDLCLYGLSMQQAAVHSVAFQVPYSCLYTIYLVTCWALQLSRE